MELNKIHLLPKDITNIIKEYYYQLVHTERLEKIHTELFLKHYILYRPLFLRSIGYFLYL